MRAHPSLQPRRPPASDDLEQVGRELVALAQLLPDADAARCDPGGLLALAAERLVTGLGLDLAYLEFAAPNSARLEAARVRTTGGPPPVHAVRQAVAPWVDAEPPDRVEILDPWAPGTLVLAPLAAGVDRRLRLIAGARRADFPDGFETGLLRLAAAQVALALECALALAAGADERAARRRAEEALEQRTRERAETERRKTEFLAMLAHELRNPLAPIRNGVALLRRLGPGDDALRRVWDILDRQSGQMARLIDDLLDISRVSRGQILLRRERLDAVPLVRQVLEDHRLALEAKHLALDVHLPVTAVWIDGDRTRVAQSLGNLLSNAEKFTPTGGEIAVRMASDGRTVSVAVRDTGAGMAPEILARIFEPFTQAAAAHEDGQAGLGLGLALAKALVELHGGRVTAESPGMGRGATFTLHLPVAGPAAAGGEARVEPRVATSARRVLVIEDKPDAAESMRLLLEAFGHQAAVAHTGQAGVRLADEFAPDVVLCDIGLPKGMDGYAVARALRSRPSGARAYLIALTGYGQEDDQRRAREAGFDLHLTKPMDPRALEQLLAGLPAPRDRTP